MSDSMREDTEIGPQARHDLREALRRQVAASLAKALATCSAASSSQDRA